MSFWAVVQAEAQHEHVVRLLLMRQRFETYLPRIRIRNRIVPLFGTYCFVRVIDRWYPILWTAGVVRVLMSGDKPARVADEIITNIRRSEINGLVRLPVRKRQFKLGQKVKVVSGPFVGATALYAGQSSRDRERILLELLGQHVAAELPTSIIAPIPHQTVPRHTTPRLT